MNTRAINAAAGVIHAAMRTHQTAAGIAAAVDAAGMLMSPETATAHAAEVDRWKATAASWRQRYYAEAGVRWDDELPPGGEVCAECEQPVESEPCPEHNPRTLVARLRAERDEFADRVDTLTAVAKSNKRHVQTLAAELETAQARVAKLEQQAAVVAEFVAARAEYITSILNCHPDNGHDYDRWQGHAESRRQLAETLGLPVAWPPAVEDGERS